MTIKKKLQLRRMDLMVYALLGLNICWPSSRWLHSIVSQLSLALVSLAMLCWSQFFGSTIKPGLLFRYLLWVFILPSLCSLSWVYGYATSLILCLSMQVLGPCHGGCKGLVFAENVGVFVLLVWLYANKVGSFLFTLCGHIYFVGSSQAMPLSVLGLSWFVDRWPPMHHVLCYKIGL